MPERAGFVGLLVDFGRELRAAGLTVGSGDIMTYCAAMAELDPSDLVDLYWAGRAVLVTKKDDIAGYDEVFRRFFLGTSERVAALPQAKASTTVQARSSSGAPRT